MICHQWFYFKGPLTQISESVDIFAFTWNICQRLHIIANSSFWDKCIFEKQNVCLQTERNNRICQKVAYAFET